MSEENISTSSGTITTDIRYFDSDELLERREAIQRFLRDKHDPAKVRALTLGDEPFERKLWKELTDGFGVFETIVPNALGGLGLGFEDFSMVLSELGRVLYSGPVFGSGVLSLGALLSLSSSDNSYASRAADLVTRVTSGELISAFGFMDRMGDFGSHSNLRASGDDASGWRVSGTRHLVVNGGEADGFCVVGEADDGVGIFWILSEHATVEIVESIDPTRPLATLTFDEAPAIRLGKGPAAINAEKSALRFARLALASEGVACADEVLKLTVDFVQAREQFGQPIGKFQAIKHKCADALIAIESARATLRYACWSLDDDTDESELALLAAKVAATEAFVQVASDGIQLHGTMGYTREPLPQSYFRRAKWLAALLGPSEIDKAEIARLIGVGPESASGGSLEPGRMFRLRLPEDADLFRIEVRQWLADHPTPTGDELLDVGYMVPQWPEPWGINASGAQVLIINEELSRASVERPEFKLARDYVGPLILVAGTEDQRQRYLRPMLAGSEVWCQLFSEPGAGSDLASLTTRAERDGEEYVVNGSKIWTTHGHLSDFGLLLARTNGEVAKHKGISCMICPMDTQGVSLQPIYNMEGEHKWNMVFFDDVHLPIENLIGEENDGWRVARVVLSNERMSMSSADGLAWGSGPSYLDLLVIARQLNKESPLLPGIREELASGWIKALSLHVMRTQALGRINHEQKGDVIPEVRRTLADEHGQAMIELWRDLYGPAGMALFPGSSEREINFAENYFYARALTLGGGTGQIQRNILAERILGLPR